MKKLLFFILIVITFTSKLLIAQDIYYGPRFGVTFMNGRLAEHMEDDFGINPVMTQFGWQHENRFFKTENGGNVLFQSVGLVAGLEQNKFLPSASFIIGYRGPSGAEFGIGPNLSLAGVGLVYVIGKTFSPGEINIPINLAVAPSGEGSRISLLTGFNISQRKKADQHN